ncbi:hypothetical protein KXD40_008101 [Peronospora effusa]|nr:hypothetical protein KXD40_008101 [Peronospora effusa]
MGENQTINDIRQDNSVPYRRRMTLADKFASKWKTILGVVHHTTPSDQQESAFDKFVQITANKRLSSSDNVFILEKISSD